MRGIHQILIAVSPSLIVNVSQIKEASRNGSYTCLKIDRGPSVLFFEQVWDEDKTVWKQLERACFPLIELGS